MHAIALQQFYNTYMGRKPRTINVTMENKLHYDVITIYAFLFWLKYVSTIFDQVLVQKIL